MKKLFSWLTSFLIVTSCSLSISSCKTNTDISIKYTDEEKIASIFNLKNEQILANKIELNSIFSDDIIDSLTKFLDIDQDINNSKSKAWIKSTLPAFILSNQFLSQISTKIPGYSWIANKITWQSRWTLKDLFKSSDENFIYLYNNVGGWMNSKDDWSLSVTFLDKNKNGWNGFGNPAFARININRKLVADQDGYVNIDKSNKKVIYNKKDSSNVPNVQNIFVNPNNPEKGVIYQGYWNSSELFDLSNVLIPELINIPLGVLNFSPSVTDFINNKISNSDFENKILKTIKGEVEEKLNKYLLEKPFYISENMICNHIENVIKNKIFLIYFIKLIDRKNIKINDKPLFEKEELSIIKTFLKNNWQKLINKINNLKYKDYLKDKLTKIEELLKLFEQIKSQDYEFKSIDKSNFEKLFWEIIELSRNQKDPNSGQIDFYVGFINAKLIKKQRLSSKKIDLANVDSYLDFGFNSDYLFEVYYWANSTPKEEDLINHQYSPDNNRPIDDSIADKGFRNVFLELRFNKFLDNKDSIFDKYISNLNDKKIELDIFEFKKKDFEKDASIEKIMQDILKFILKQNNLEIDKPINYRIYHLAWLINYYATLKLKEIFGYYNKEKKELEIHRKNISLDYYNKEIIQDKADDDIAFAELIEKGKLNIICNDFKRSNINNKENFRYLTWENFEDVFSNKKIINQYIFVGKINTFGQTLDSEEEIKNINKWWNDEDRYQNLFSYNIYVPEEWKNKLFDFWKKYVSNNPLNPDNNIK